MPGEIPYKKYTRVKDLAAAVAEGQKILYFINLLFSGRICARCYRELIRGTVSGHCWGTVRALSGHCQMRAKTLERDCICARVCEYGQMMGANIMKYLIKIWHETFVTGEGDSGGAL